MFSSKATSQPPSAVVCRRGDLVFWWEMWNGDRDVGNPENDRISVAVHLRYLGDSGRYRVNSISFCRFQQRISQADSRTGGYTVFMRPLHRLMASLQQPEACQKHRAFHQKNSSTALRPRRAIWLGSTRRGQADGRDVKTECSGEEASCS